MLLGSKHWSAKTVVELLRLAAAVISTLFVTDQLP